MGEPKYLGNRNVRGAEGEKGADPQGEPIGMANRIAWRAERLREPGCTASRQNKRTVIHGEPSD